MFDLIAFDADDTLWENEALYRAGRETFRSLMRTYDPPDPTSPAPTSLLDERLDQVEIGNLKYFGYGAMSYGLSMIETAVEITAGRVSADHIQAIVNLARGIIAAEVELYEHAEPTLRALSSSYPLMLITKGDLLHQQSKVERSGLKKYFQYVEVVADKTIPVYRALLQRVGVSAERFLMVGNSLRSDILPVLELGGRGVYVPAAEGWAHEHAELPPHLCPRFHEIENLSQLPGLLQNLSNGF